MKPDEEVLLTEIERMMVDSNVKRVAVVYHKKQRRYVCSMHTRDGRSLAYESASLPHAANILMEAMKKEQRSS